MQRGTYIHVSHGQEELSLFVDRLASSPKM